MGQMSDSPANGEIVIVFLSKIGILLVMPPSTKYCVTGVRVLVGGEGVGY